MFSVFMLARLRRPMPPIPIPAMLSLSLGDVCPYALPSMVLGAIVIPAVANAAVLRKSRLSMLVKWY